MYIWLLPLALFCFMVCTGGEENCSVYPKDPVIAKGESIRIEFKAPNNGSCSNIPSYSPRKIFWMLNNEKIVENQYNIVDPATPAVTIGNFGLPRATVTCHIYVDGKDILLGGTTITANPVKPTNISCLTVYETRDQGPFSCSWEFSTTLDTKYTVFRKINLSVLRCNSKSSPCTFRLPNETVKFDSEVWVTAQNAQGTAKSDPVFNNYYSTVKVGPPQNLQVTSDFENLNMKVTWERPVHVKNSYVVYEVRYRYEDSMKHTKPLSNSSTVIPIERQCTNYTISVRCAVTTYDSSTIGLWSGWSPEVTVISPLDVRNEHLRIWRLRSRVKENRTVQLLWKGPPASCHAVDHYLVTLEPKSYQGKTKLPETSSSASITLHSKEAYNVSIAAYRKKTKVLESTLTIPAIAKEDSGLSPVAEAHAFSLSHQIYVHWSAPHWSPQGYIVHWCCIGHDCEWQETQATNITLKGHPKKLYAITVVPFSKSLWPGQETTVLGYSEEGAPGKVSNVDVSEETRTGALVKWSPVSRDSCCGFVVNYTVFYRNGEGRERWVTVNDTVQEVRLEHLQPGSQYQVHVMSSSVAGTTNSSEYNFRTSSYDPSFIRMLSIFGSLGIIFLLIIGISCFAVVKKYVLKPVPNPADSDLMSSLPENMNRPLLIPDSMSENLNISVCTVGPSVDGSVPSIPSLEDNQETPDCLPGLTSAPVEPSSSLPVTQGWPVHGEEQKGMDPAMSGSSYLCNKLDNSQSKLATEPVLVPAQAPAQAQAPAPAPAKENRALQEIQAWRPDSQPMQAYVSLDMLDRAV